MNRAKIILNPFGGRYKRAKKIRLLKQALAKAGLEYEVTLTEGRGHGYELAQEAAQQQWPIIVAAGGDGTVNEVLNGLMAGSEGQPASALGIIPLGTANDLASMLPLPRDLTQICQRLGQGQTRLLDVGQVNGHYFINNAAVGLEPMVTMAHEQLRWLSGNARYLAAALKTIMNARTWQMQLKWHDDEYDGSITLVSVGNTRRTGGAFYMTPHAVPDDGLLDFVFGVGMARWQMLRLLPQTFTGQHIHHPLVTYRQTTFLSITATPPTPIQADGEIIDRQAHQIDFKITPGALRVVV